MHTNQTIDPDGAASSLALQPDQLTAVSAASTPHRTRKSAAHASGNDTAATADHTTDASVQSAEETTGTIRAGRTGKATGSNAKMARSAGSRSAASVSAANSASSAKPTERDRQSSATARKSVAARDGSKTELVLKKLRLAKGASIAQLSEATGWQAHSVRGFLSAVVRKKLGLELVSEVGKDGARRYRLADGAAN